MSFDNADGLNKPMLTAIDFMILFGMDKDQAEFAAAKRVASWRVI